jgi:hypothetical protein
VRIRLSLTLFFLAVLVGGLVGPIARTADAAGSGVAGTAAWKSGTLTTPELNLWDGNAFGASTMTADVGAWRIFAWAEAPTRTEIILAGSSPAGVIQGEIWNGSSWSALTFNHLATVTDPSFWDVAVAYEEVSGDAVLVWGNGTSGSAGLSYRAWNGTEWSGESITTT